MPGIIQIHFVNFGYSEVFSKIEDAVEAAKKAFFEASILVDGALVASFHPLRGFVFYSKD